MILGFFRKISFVLLGSIAMLCMQGCEKHSEQYYNYDEQLSVFNGTTYDYLVEKGGYDSLLLVIDRVTGLKEALQNDEVTLFAVQNNSFKLSLEALNLVRRTSNPARPAHTLSTLDSANLDTLASRYILTGLYDAESANLKDGAYIPSIKYGYVMNMKYERVNASGYQNGGPQRLYFGDTKTSKDGIIPPFDYWIVSPTQIVNVKTKNGYVHVLAAGHDFGFGDEFVKRMNNP
ncbi:hypothetical protein ACFS6H_18410 [Terrimonas rubra]|uniref:Fasciclin domain-containing protein n=1 Tax=Terrimonas rubra TaxID=1035890 RepID=A0ABW6A900_9BACT